LLQTALVDTSHGVLDAHQGQAGPDRQFLLQLARALLPAPFALDRRHLPARRALI